MSLESARLQNASASTALILTRRVSEELHLYHSQPRSSLARFEVASLAFYPARAQSAEVDGARARHRTG
jgi:hypothetical protein